jgi:hypothetical protein
MAKQFQVVAAVLALAFSIPVLSQTRPLLGADPGTEPAVAPASVTVQQLAPQLVDFAGSPGNFQSLVNGLALGLPVTLVTLTPDGFTQTVIFTPAAALTPVDIARTLELARQNLIARGIARPTAQQLGIALAGGTLPTAVGAVPVAGLIPVATSASTAASASMGASVAVAPSPAAGGLVVQIAPTPAQLQTPGSVATSAPAPRFTSDSPLLRNTSDSPLPAVPAIPLFNTSASPAPAVSASPAFNTSNSPVLAPSAGGPSPAAQLQNRR